MVADLCKPCGSALYSFEFINVFLAIGSHTVDAYSKIVLTNVCRHVISTASYLLASFVSGTLAFF